MESGVPLPAGHLARSYLELGRDLVDEWDELLEVLGLAVFEHVLRGRGDEGQHLFLEADDHAVEEGADPAPEDVLLQRAAEGRQEGLQTVQVDLGAATLLHSLLVAEGLAGSTT